MDSRAMDVPRDGRPRDGRPRDGRPRGPAARADQGSSATVPLTLTVTVVLPSAPGNGTGADSADAARDIITLGTGSGRIGPAPSTETVRTEYVLKPSAFAAVSAFAQKRRHRFGDQLAFDRELRGALSQ
ncbi:MAG: hypothetical protein R3E41_14590 [Burkholderiaceae bacterium]